MPWLEISTWQTNKTKKTTFHHTYIVCLLPSTTSNVQKLVQCHFDTPSRHKLNYSSSKAYFVRDWWGEDALITWTIEYVKIWYSLYLKAHLCMEDDFNNWRNLLPFECKTLHTYFSDVHGYLIMTKCVHYWIGVVQVKPWSTYFSSKTLFFSFWNHWK